jgi:hypothetical protein
MLNYHTLKTKTLITGYRYICNKDIDNIDNKDDDYNESMTTKIIIGMIFPCTPLVFMRKVYRYLYSY